MKKIQTITLLVAITIFTTVIFSYAVQNQNRADQVLLDRQADRDLNDLTTVEALIRVLHTTGVPGGIEEITGCDQSVKFLLTSAGSSLRDALESIVSVNPKYKWEISRGVINLVYRNSGPPFLDLPVDKFEVVDVNIDEAVDYLLKMPEVKKREAELNR
ncbi:MAG: hypothetical protein ACRD4L_03895, partial [Pyrinomonadaceae bacterium]